MLVCSIAYSVYVKWLYQYNPWASVWIVFIIYIINMFNPMVNQICSNGVKYLNSINWWRLVSFLISRDCWKGYCWQGWIGFINSNSKHVCVNLPYLLAYSLFKALKVFGVYFIENQCSVSNGHRLEYVLVYLKTKTTSMSACGSFLGYAFVA